MATQPYGIIFTEDSCVHVPNYKMCRSVSQKFHSRNFFWVPRTQDVCLQPGFTWMNTPLCPLPDFVTPGRATATPYLPGDPPRPAGNNQIPQYQESTSKCVSSIKTLNSSTINIILSRVQVQIPPGRDLKELWNSQQAPLENFGVWEN